MLEPVNVSPDELLTRLKPFELTVPQTSGPPVVAELFATIVLDREVAPLLW